MKKFFGKIIYGFGKGLASVLGAIISVLEWLIEGVRLIGRGVVAALFGLGCFIIWLSPIVLGAIFHPKVFPFVIGTLMIVVLGKPFVSALRYGAFVPRKPLWTTGNISTVSAALINRSAIFLTITRECSMKRSVKPDDGRKRPIVNTIVVSRKCGNRCSAVTMATLMILEPVGVDSKVVRSPETARAVPDNGADPAMISG